MIVDLNNRPMNLITPRKRVATVKDAVSVTKYVSKSNGYDDGDWDKFQITFDDSVYDKLPKRMIIGLSNDRLYFIASEGGWKISNQHESYNLRIQGGWDERLLPFTGEKKDLLYDIEIDAYYITI